MNDQTKLRNLIEVLLLLRSNIIALKNTTYNDNIRFYLDNALDYYEGLAKEILAALEAAEKE